MKRSGGLAAARTRHGRQRKVVLMAGREVLGSCLSRLFSVCMAADPEPSSAVSEDLGLKMSTKMIT